MTLRNPHFTILKPFFYVTMFRPLLDVIIKSTEKVCWLQFIRTKNNGWKKKGLTLRIKQNVWHVLGNGLTFFLEARGSNNLLNENRFRVLKKCHGKFDSLVFEMLPSWSLKPSLNTQMDLYVPNVLFNSQY